ncbi:manganese-binding transcriptional regulator MntR [Tropicimonas sp. IMCC6043]|uniref:manganese-binding transcriptional regulator MntR n=1 Tax=Tropicimonas sp. IMCC6043 TaxID=2510645 RepID=UPI00101BC493|nr:manganese-binding transcriptional regulator MntR [Tropicimonas sp. IMCC6043]RYH08781.1 manganese-binding transcriptional regulator MntR [Tropicimonas sp. IMCC6043]
MQQDRADEGEATVEPERFNQARAAQSMAVLEDYVEMIGDLISEFGEARITDIAQRMGVTHPTATKAVSRLKREGLAVSRPYRGVFLTEAGAELAERVRMRHRTLVDFLVAVGVPAETAELDAEGMEHHVSDATLRAFETYLERARASDGPDFQD